MSRSIEKLTEFLENFRKSPDSGWPEVTCEDLATFSLIVNTIIREKWDTDCDDWAPVQVDITNLTEEIRPWRKNYTLSEYAESEEEKKAIVKDNLNAAVVNCKCACEDVQRYTQLLKL